MEEEEEEDNLEEFAETDGGHVWAFTEFNEKKRK